MTRLQNLYRQIGLPLPTRWPNEEFAHYYQRLLYGLPDEHRHHILARVVERALEQLEKMEMPETPKRQIVGT
jgi:hypothetical protein